MIDVIWSKVAIDDLLYWEKHDLQKHRKIRKLVEDIKANPFSGIGKPEPLKFEFSGLWSRRISKEHRLIYSFEASVLKIYRCKSHYEL